LHIQDSFCEILDARVKKSQLDNNRISRERRRTANENDDEDGDIHGAMRL